MRAARLRAVLAGLFLPLAQPTDRPISWLSVMVEAVGEEPTATLEELLEDSRRRPVAAARHRGWWRLYQTRTLGLWEIARPFGTDHSTIRYGIRRHKERARARALEALR